MEESCSPGSEDILHFSREMWGTAWQGSGGWKVGREARQELLAGLRDHPGCPMGWRCLSSPGLEGRGSPMGTPGAPPGSQHQLIGT